MSNWAHHANGAVTKRANSVPLCAVWIMALGGLLVRDGRTSATINLAGELFTCQKSGAIVDQYGNALETHHNRAIFDGAFSPLA